MSPFKNFLLFCSGVERDLLINCPTETGKYVGLGGAVLGTACFATLSAFVALQMGMPHLPLAASVLLAAGWGAFIFNFDRWFVASYRFTPHRAWQIGLIVPRLLIALAFGTVIAVPVVLTVFAPEIKRQMALNHAEARQAAQTRANNNPVYADIAALEESNRDSKAQLAERQSLRDARYREYLEEAEGVSGTGKVGKGPVFEEKGERLKEAQAELAAFRAETEAQMTAQTKRITELRAAQSRELSTLDTTDANATGILERMHALDQISEKDPVMARAHRMITILFILLDTSPVLLKLLMSLQKKTVYDDQLEAQECMAGKVARCVREEAQIDGDTQIESLRDYHAALRASQKANAAMQAGAVTAVEHEVQMKQIELWKERVLDDIDQNPHQFFTGGQQKPKQTQANAATTGATSPASRFGVAGTP